MPPQGHVQVGKYTAPCMFLVLLLMKHSARGLLFPGAAQLQGDVVALVEEVVAAHASWC